MATCGPIPGHGYVIHEWGWSQAGKQGLQPPAQVFIAVVSGDRIGDTDVQSSGFAVAEDQWDGHADPLDKTRAHAEASAFVGGVLVAYDVSESADQCDDAPGVGLIPPIRHIDLLVELGPGLA